MKTLAVLLTIFLFNSPLLQAKSLDSKECMLNAKAVLFQKSIYAFSQKFKEEIKQKSLQNLYTDYEVQKILSDDTFLYSKDLCQGGIILSIKEFVHTLNENCLSQNIEFDVKDFNLVLLNELSDKYIKYSGSGETIRKSRIKKHLIEMSKKSFQCSDIQLSIKSVLNLDINEAPEKVCENLLTILNTQKSSYLSCKN